MPTPSQTGFSPESSSGTFAFLFTDLVGSTRLWEENPDAMHAVLARHDLLVRDAVLANGGQVFKSTGDGIAAVFTTAPDALRAALTAQQALLVEPWPAGLALSARMAIHVGTAEVRDGDYFGPPLNRVARMTAAGFGGQVLLSQVTYELSRDNLPEAASVVELGQHRLRDLARPEQIWQLTHPTLPRDFPPLRSLENPTLLNNLPQQVSSFIGREKELAAVHDLLVSGRDRLVTLLGAGGTGKTRLSLQAAADLLDEERFPDGVWFIELAPLSDPALVPAVVAQTLGIREEAGMPLLHTLTDQLKPKRMLLILDNCEHLIDAAARLADTLLRSCSHLFLLATSREPLGIGGERTFRVPSLTLPEPKRPASVQSLSQYEAVRLFVDRALAVRPDFTVTNENAPAIAHLCWRLDGIPLALELAAARVRSLSVETINTRLDQRFRLLTGGSRTALPRQQTLQALIDWSWDLLSETERAVLRRLAVFAGGWTMEAAETICGFDPVEDWETLDILTGLVDKSLVVADELPYGTLRYRLLESMRAYAGERLRETGEAPIAQERHRDWYTVLIETAEPHLTGSDQVTWFHRLETEHDNLRAALESCPLGTVAGINDALRLAIPLAWFWYVRGYLTEGRDRVGVILTAIEQTTVPLEDHRNLGTLYHMAGVLAFSQSDFAAARTYYTRALELRQEVGNQGDLSSTLNSLGMVLKDEGHYDEARALFEQALAICRARNNPSGTAAALNTLGQTLRIQRDFATARVLHEEALEICRTIGHRQGEGIMLGSLAAVAREERDYPRAREFYEKALALFRELGERIGTASVLHYLAIVVHHEGDATRSEALLRESLEMRRDIGDRRGIASGLEGFAVLAGAAGQQARAATLAGAAETLRRRLGVPIPVEERPLIEETLTKARAALGESEFAQAREQGRSRNESDAGAFALSVPDAGTGETAT